MWRIRRRRNRTVAESDRRKMQPNPLWCRKPHFLCPWSPGLRPATLDKGLQPMLSVPFFHSEFSWQSLHLCLLGFSEACAFIALLKENVLRDVPLSAVNPQKWGECRMSLSPGRAVLTLWHAVSALQLLKKNWEAQKSERVTSASEIN